MIKVYHHIYPFQAGEGIVENQKKRLFEKITDEFEYKPNVVKIHQTELWTLKTLQNDCKFMDDDTPILYIHTKGATKPTVERAQWREYMERELIDNYKFHIDILSKGFSSSGVLMGIPYWSSTIYGGNFWWTKGSYYMKLDDNIPDYYIAPENHICTKNPKAGNLFSTKLEGVGHYTNLFPMINYVDL